MQAPTEDRMVWTALALASRGLHVFPCRPRSKEPATANGFKDATTDPDTIRAWWRREPQFNVAFATGPASGCFVLDVDGFDGEAALRKLEERHGALPATAEVITPRPGRHLWFAWPATGGPPCTVGWVATGLDVRGAGGYVMTPPERPPRRAPLRLVGR